MQPVKVLLTEAMRRTFDADYPEADFRNINISIEFPVERQDYPGIWVDFEPTSELQIAGVGHLEFSGASETGQGRQFTRWRFAGYATYTVVALTSLERDRLLDEVIRVMAFGPESDQTSEFRAFIESNEYLAVNFDFDQIGLMGKGESPGTPWGTDDIVYEQTVRMECVGEFVSDGLTRTLLPLSAVEVVAAYSDTETDPTTADGWQ